ncbi:MAG: hypothetical protein ACI80V_002473 [Rhodothermales bacterium]|jgi:hypothetical protein
MSTTKQIKRQVIMAAAILGGFVLIMVILSQIA